MWPLQGGLKCPTTFLPCGLLGHGILKPHSFHVYAVTVAFADEFSTEYDRIVGSLVKIVIPEDRAVGRSYTCGSGFIVGGTNWSDGRVESFVWTALHVVRGGDYTGPITAIHKGQTYACSKGFHTEVLDFACVRVHGLKSDGRILPLSKTCMPGIFGNAYGYKGAAAVPHFSRGIVGSPANYPDSVKLDAITGKGFSGVAVINASGEVFAMVIAGDCTTGATEIMPFSYLPAWEEMNHHMKAATTRVEQQPAKPEAREQATAAPAAREQAAPKPLPQGQPSAQGPPVKRQRGNE